MKDYDLCTVCFSKTSKEADFTRIDKHSRHGIFSPHLHGFGVRQSRPKLESCFIQNITVLDGTLMPPSTPTKIWRMQNNGTTRWPYRRKLVWAGGDKFDNKDSFLLEIPVDGISVNKEVDVAVDLTSPAVPGTYFSYWRLASPFGQMLGQRVWVHIEMDISQPNSATGGFNPDLNLPPENSSRCWLGPIDAEPFQNAAPKPIPRTLQGFSDRAWNNKLLIKRGGSIKQV